MTKGGDNQGSDSHIRIDVTNGVTVVALTNTNPPSVETSTLTQQLLTIALANPVAGLAPAVSFLTKCVGRVHPQTASGGPDRRQQADCTRPGGVR